MSTLALVTARNLAASRNIDAASRGNAAQRPTPERPSQILVRGVHAAISQATFGLSPAALGGAFFDWWEHLALDCGKQLDLAQLVIASAVDFAARVDFTEAGELMLFIDESQVIFLEDMMWERGYLDSRQMAGAFQMLCSNDLIWSRSLHDCLMGEQPFAIDIMAWNADATRMQYRMHSQYLRSLFLKDDLAEGRFRVGGRPVALPDIRVPVFAVAIERDDVAPWRSVFTFVLTDGGHNVGILTEPGHLRRHYRISSCEAAQRSVDPDGWFAENAPHEGSWWPAWTTWLAACSGEPIRPPPLGDTAAGFAVLEDGGGVTF